MLTKKHFIAIADILRTVEGNATKRRLIGMFNDMFKQENPNYDAEKFLSACYVKEGE